MTRLVVGLVVVLMVLVVLIVLLVVLLLLLLVVVVMEATEVAVVVIVVVRISETGQFLPTLWGRDEPSGTPTSQYGTSANIVLIYRYHPSWS